MRSRARLFGNGRIGRRFSSLDAVYGAVVAAALWMTIDTIRGAA
jgi:hypothetical protein